MKTKSILFVAVLALFAQACAKKEQKTFVKSSRAARTPYTEVSQSGGGNMPFTGSAATNGKVWGAMTKGNISEYDFQRSVKAFVSSTIDPQSFGDVSSSNTYSTTGIRFWGNIATVTPVSRAGNNVTQITSYSAFKISIWDQFAGKQDEFGQVVPEYGVFFQGNIWGNVYGNYAQIHMEDAYGSITITGQINGDTFNGSLSFENNQYWDGAGPGAAGDYVWAFAIPTCSFFNCQ